MKPLLRSCSTKRKSTKSSALAWPPRDPMRIARPVCSSVPPRSGRYPRQTLAVCRISPFKDGATRPTGVFAYDFDGFFLIRFKEVNPSCNRLDHTLDRIGLLANHLPARNRASIKKRNFERCHVDDNLRPLRSPWICSASLTMVKSVCPAITEAMRAGPPPTVIALI